MKSHEKISGMYIDGQWVNTKSGATFDVFNPYNGEKIGEVADGDAVDAEQAIEAAQRAFNPWSSLTDSLPTFKLSL